MARLTQPFNPIQELGITQLVGPDQQVDQNEYAASVAALLGPSGYNKPISGEILHLTLFSRETGSGSVQTPAGQLLVLDADPATAAGDTSITAAERLTVIGAIPVTADDWISDANGASATIFTKPLAFHALHSLYLLWFHEDATSLNDAAGDDEILEVNAWYRMDS
jgi:hypothetical protein